MDVDKRGGGNKRGGWKARMDFNKRGGWKCAWRVDFFFQNQ